MARETGYYDMLGVSPSATERQIMRAYYVKAREFHPEVNPNGARAAAKFQEPGETYHVLSDPARRQAYDSHGSSGVSTEAMIDPAEIYAMQFGSEIFEDYIGQLSMASMASLDIYNEDEQVDTRKMRKNLRLQKTIQKERQEKLAEKLKNRLTIHVQGNKEEFIQFAEAEVSRLSDAAYGFEMLSTMGYMYSRQAAKEIGMKADLLGGSICS